MTMRRGNLSASTAPNGAVTAINVSRIAPQTPTAVVPPTPYAHTATAVA